MLRQKSLDYVCCLLRMRTSNQDIFKGYCILVPGAERNAARKGKYFFYSLILFADFLQKSFNCPANCSAGCVVIVHLHRKYKKFVF